MTDLALAFVRAFSFLCGMETIYIWIGKVVIILAVIIGIGLLLVLLLNFLYSKFKVFADVVEYYRNKKSYQEWKEDTRNGQKSARFDIGKYELRKYHDTDIIVIQNSRTSEYKEFDKDDFEELIKDILNK